MAVVPPAVSTVETQSDLATAQATEDAGLPSTGQELTQAAATKLNLNSATETDFLTIRGMGNRMVLEFMEYPIYLFMINSLLG